MPTEPSPRRFSLPRPVLPHSLLNLIVASYIMVALNGGFWSRLADQFPAAPLKAGLFGLAVWALTFLLLELLGPGRAQKPVAAALIMVAASAHYYEQSFGILIDREVMRAIFETTLTESGHMVTPDMILTIGLTGVLPAALVFWPRVRRVGPWHQLWRWPLGVVLPALLCIAVLFSFYKDYSAMLRERHDLMGAYQPGAALSASVRYAREEWKSADPVAAPVGRDAAAGPLLAAAEKPVLLVLYVGETARAANFGLDGYARDTTPELRKRDVINFTDVTSCGTSTAVSVPCMFSPLAKADYSHTGFLSHENLLDVLDHAGVKTLWADNNTGDQRVAARTGWNRVDATLTPEACTRECTDEVFLPLIRKTAAEMTGNTVLVLHMIGSHGPAYHLRYPEGAATFTPDCQTSQFSDCTGEQIVNAYDNSIMETDRVLSASIDLLAGQERVIPALLYVSDHGESLGENGLYLHAAPDFMAPPEQTRVPMVLWLSAPFRAAMGLDAGCMAQVARQPASHDNYFHTVLGLMDIQTGARDAALDLTATCRKKDLT